jgi:ATP synthase protein I
LRLTPVQAERRAALRVLVAQVAITVAVAALAAVGWGAAAARSALWGGGIGVAGAALMVLALFRHTEGAGATRIALGFYLGQLLKVALSVALLLLAFRQPGVVPLALLAGFVASFAGYFVAPRQPLPRR